MTTVIVDSGPLVALLNRHDAWHPWAVGRFGSLEARLVTCEAVLTESAHLLRRDPKGPAALLQLVGRDLLEVGWAFEHDAEDVRKLMWRYRDQPMSFADACLVRMSEQLSDCRVMTLDSDFKRYRRHGRSVIPLVAPTQRAAPAPRRARSAETP